MTDLRIPTLNANDDSYVLVEWTVPDGAEVRAGDTVALIETSKAAADLLADSSGYLRHLAVPGTACRPGDALARVYPDKAQARAAAVELSRSEPAPTTASGSRDIVVTAGARALLEHHSLTLDDLPAEGRTLIRRSDVQALLDQRCGEPDALSPAQRRVAAVVSLSHATIPSGFVLLTVDADELVRRQQWIGATTGTFPGLPEFVVHAAAGLRDRFPSLFAAVTPDLGLVRHHRSDVAVTLDVGGGLVLPVVRDADKLSPEQISAELMRLRVRALRGQLREADLGPAAITLTLHTQRGVVSARPFVVPGQTCALALCATRPEVVVDDAGRPRTRTIFNLGASYDHRAVNGREAVGFLSAVRDLLEAADQRASAP